MFTFLRVLLLALFAQVAFAGEPPTEPILRFDLGEHTATIGRIASDADGRWTKPRGCGICAMGACFPQSNATQKQ